MQLKMFNLMFWNFNCIFRELSDSKYAADILDPRCITPVERAREKRKIRKEKTNASLSTSSKKVTQPPMSDVAMKQLWILIMSLVSRSFVISLDLLFCHTGNRKGWN